MRKNRGFTLLELMIVITVVAILAAVAYPLYTDQIRKGRRSEARQALSDLALRQEKWRSYNTTYGDCTQVFTPSNCAGMNNTLLYYNIGITTGSNTGTGFVATATPKNGQEADKCGTLTLTMTATVLTKCPSAATLCATHTDCW